MRLTAREIRALLHACGECDPAAFEEGTGNEHLMKSWETAQAKLLTRLSQIEAAMTKAEGDDNG